MVRRLIAVSGIVLIPHFVGAQQPADTAAAFVPAARALAAAPICTDSAATVGSYADCALRNEGFVVRQGLAGSIVASPRIFRGPVIAPLVRGDSALAYAQLFQRQIRRSHELGLVATAALVGGAVLLSSRCHPTSPGSCPPSHKTKVGLALSATGLGLIIPASYFSSRARKSLSAALWWNNARFAR